MSSRKNVKVVPSSRKNVEVVPSSRKNVKVVPSCTVCYEDDLTLIACIGCKFEACFDCNKTYILGSSRKASCMKCKMEWDIQFLYDNFDKKWIDSNREDGYRTHTKRISIEAEKSKIPNSLATTYKALKDIAETEEKMRKADSFYRTVYIKLGKLDEGDKKIAHYLEMKRRISALKNRLIIRRANFNRMYLNYVSGRDPNYGFVDEDTLLQPVLAAAPKNNYTFICPCPEENCKGMISVENYTCVVCKSQICKECRVLLDGDKHKCKKNDVLTFKAMKKDTKACPKCAINIYKIEGCDQFFCTVCHTAFSWNTGEILTGIIHNPHAMRWYAEHQHQQPQPEGACDNVRHPGQYHCSIYCRDEMYQAQRQTINTVFVEMGELEYVIAKYSGNSELPAKYENNRISYIENKIDEKEWIRRTFSLDREFQRNKLIVDIVGTYREVMMGEFRNLRDIMFEINRRLNAAMRNTNRVIPPDYVKRVIREYGTFLQAHREIAEFTIQALDNGIKLHGGRIKNKILAKSRERLGMLKAQPKS